MMNRKGVSLFLFRLPRCRRNSFSNLFSNPFLTKKRRMRGGSHNPQKRIIPCKVKIRGDRILSEHRG